MKVIQKLLLTLLMFTTLAGCHLHANMFSNFWAGLSKNSKCVVVGVGLVAAGLALYKYSFDHSKNHPTKEEQQKIVDQEIAFSQFINKYYLRDKKLQQALYNAATSNETWHYDRNDNSIKIIPGVAVIKPCDISRVINAERMRTFIEKNNLNLLSVPRKYFYRVGGRVQIVAQYVTKSKNQLKMTLPLMQQLVMLAEETSFGDWQPENWCFDEQGRFTVLDTEDRSFDLYCYNNRLNRVLLFAKRFQSRFQSTMLPVDKDAAQWLEERISQLKAEGGATYPMSLSANTDFDDPAINIENVKLHQVKMGKLQTMWVYFLEALLLGAHSKRLYLMG